TVRVDANPTVTITAPTTTTVAAGTSITFVGGASDNEDGDLTGTIVWSDGTNTLGTGPTFSATFPAGDYVITASATDSAAKTASGPTWWSASGGRPSSSTSCPTACSPSPAAA